MKSNMKSTISHTLSAILLVVSLVSPAGSVKASRPRPKPDLPLDQLLPLAVVDINQYWQTNFSSLRLRYVVPNIVRYDRPIATPCGASLMKNATYCAASNSIYFDYNWISSVYSNVGDYAAVSIMAHEWGHLVQTQLGLSNGTVFSIQNELGADCFSGAYTKYAEVTGKLEEGDMEEAGAGLFNSGDPRGMPWFAQGAHGKPMQRINAFLSGYNGGRCF
jgi:predicted metalloprotease